MSQAVKYETQGSIGVISVDNPPVNALSQAVRQGLVVDDLASLDGPGHDVVSPSATVFSGTLVGKPSSR